MIEAHSNPRTAAARAIMVIGVLFASGAVIGCDEDANPPPAASAQRSTISMQAIETALGAAQDYFDSGETAKAAAVITELLERAPDNAEGRMLYAQVIFSRGVDLRAEGRSADASEVFQSAYAEAAKAAELQPRVAGYHQSAGEFAAAAGLNAEAIGHFDKASALEPSNPKAPLWQAQLLLALGREAEAREAIDTALAISPFEPHALATLATIQFEQGDREQAFETMSTARAAARLDSERLALRVVEARLRRQAGEPGRALQLLLPLADDARAEASVAAEIASSRIAQDRVREAIDAWAHRYRVTNDWQAAAEAARVALENDLLDEAVEWHRLALVSAPRADGVLELGRRIDEAFKAGG